MKPAEPGTIAVIFSSRRRERDEAGYAAAAAAMEAAAARQPGYRGIESVRGTDGAGITISYWASAADARAWREQVDHLAIQARGRSDWYAEYRVVVAEVSRSYAWRAEGDADATPADADPQNL